MQQGLHDSLFQHLQHKHFLLKLANDMHPSYPTTSSSNSLATPLLDQHHILSMDTGFISEIDYMQISI